MPKLKYENGTGEGYSSSPRVHFVALATPFGSLHQPPSLVEFRFFLFFSVTIFG